MRRLTRTSLHRSIISALALIFVPATLIFHIKNTLPKHMASETIDLEEGRFETIALRAKVPTLDDLKSVNLFWRNGPTGDAGFIRLPMQAQGKQPQFLLNFDQRYKDYTLKYLGKQEGWSQSLYSLTSDAEIVLIHIDKAGHFVPLSHLPLQAPVHHFDVLGAFGDELMLSLSYKNEDRFHLFSVDEYGQTRARTTIQSTFNEIFDLIKPFGERSLISIKHQTVRLHTFAIEDGVWKIREHELIVPALHTPHLATTIPYEKSLALVLHNQDKRSLQVLTFEQNNLYKSKVLTLDNDEKWDRINHIQGSHSVLMYKKKTSLHGDRINILSSLRPEQWNQSHTFSTNHAVEDLVILDEHTLKEHNFQALTHKDNPIRVLQSTLEYHQSEVGGIAAVTKTLIPKLNHSKNEAHVQADVIMPKFSFLVLDNEALVKVGSFDHYFKKRLTKSAVWKVPDGPFLVEPEELIFKDMYRIPDKSTMYNDEESSLPIDRWLHFNSAVAAFISTYKDPVSNQPYHVLHMHSYHAAVTAELLDHYEDARVKAGISRPKTILHMHALSYDQGFIKGTLLTELGLKADSEWENLTKRALKVVDFGVTVSRNMYESGLSENENQSFGLSPFFRALKQNDRLVPILNGINARDWDPKDFNIDEDHVLEGKTSLKRYLKSHGYFNDDNRLLFTFVGRFSDEKGIEHLQPAVQEVIRLGGNFAIMGSFSSSFNSREMIEKLKELQKGPLAGRLLIIDTVEEQKRNQLGRYVRAASDFSFVPSREETCGLVPLEFFGFGAMTVTSHVGGLKDSVIPYAKDKDFFNGFVFDYNDLDQLYWAIKEAFSFVHTDPVKFAAMRRAIMQKSPSFDWSFEGGAVSKIIELYKRAVQL